MNIREALMLLESDNDEHWTADGLPRMEVVEELLGKDIGRAELNKTAEGFTRTNMEFKEGSDNFLDGAQESSEESDEEVAKVRQELKDAKENLADANNRLSEANSAMDKIIAKEEKANSLTTDANDIKTFQKSQLAQRKKNAAGAAALKEFMKEHKSEFGT